MTVMTHIAARPGRSSRAASARATVTLTGVQPTGDLHLAKQFARSYRPGVLREPRALIAQTTATLPGRDGRKMSKSHGNAIALMAEPDAMRKQVMRIVTDSTPPAQPKDPDACTLVALLRAFADPASVAAVEQRYRSGGIGYGAAQGGVARALDAHV